MVDSTVEVTARVVCGALVVTSGVVDGAADEVGGSLLAAGEVVGGGELLPPPTVVLSETEGVVEGGRGPVQKPQAERSRLSERTTGGHSHRAQFWRIVGPKN